MSKVLVIGAGGVSSVAIHKMAQLSNDFKEITLASRTIDNCKKIQKQIKKNIILILILKNWMQIIFLKHQILYQNILLN